MALDTRAPQFPQLTDTSPAGIRAWSRAVVAVLGQLSGQNARTANAALDNAVTFRDLIDAGIAVEAPNGNGAPVVAGPDPDVYVFTPPPAPTGFTVTRLAYNMRLAWTAPTYGYHMHTEVWRSTTNNLTNAYKIAEVPDGTAIYEDGYVEGAAWYYWVRFVSKASIAGAFNAITGTADNAPPQDVLGLTYELEGFGVRLRWVKGTDADIDAFEVRYGPTLGTSVLIDETKGTSLLWKVQAGGTYRVYVRARDVTGYYSNTAASIDVIVPNPGTITPSAVINVDAVVVSWTPVSAGFALDYYEVRTGNTYGSATVVARAFSTSYRQLVNWASNQRFWVAAVDVAGNVATPVSIDVSITVPGAVQAFRAEVIDNNALLYWTAPASGTLPINRYEVRKGATFGGSTVVGSNANSTFAAIFEQQSGVFTYWVVAYDSANNAGTPVGLPATINQPPDYILRTNYDSTFTGTLTNLVNDAGALVGPADLTETWATHFTSRSWASPQDQINAGFPLYLEPAPTSASYSEIFDAGVVLAATTITATLGYTTVVGSLTVSCQIAYKTLIGDPWTNATAGATSALATNFRYVQVTYTITSAGGANLLRITSFNLKLANKLKTDSGSANAVSTDVGGTVVNFNVTFVAADTPLVQPNGTAAVIPAVDYTSVPNPTSFKVLLYDRATGSRVSGLFSWTARGY